MKGQIATKKTKKKRQTCAPPGVLCGRCCCFGGIIRDGYFTPKSESSRSTHTRHMRTKLKNVGPLRDVAGQRKEKEKSNTIREKKGEQNTAFRNHTESEKNSVHSFHIPSSVSKDVRKARIWNGGGSITTAGAFCCGCNRAEGSNKLGGRGKAALLLLVLLLFVVRESLLAGAVAFCCATAK